MIFGADEFRGLGSRSRLHVVDAEDRLHGADCAIAIWLRTSGDVWLGRVLGL
jgi:hypothetical protein